MQTPFLDQPLFYALLALSGIAGGLLAGLLGLGGGIFFLLVLPDALAHLGVADQDMAATTVANSLVGTLFSAGAAGYQHLRQRTPGRVDILWLGIPAGLTAYLSLRYIVSRPEFSEQVFNQVVVVLLGGILARSIYTYVKDIKKHPQRAQVRARRFKIGAGVGAAEVAVKDHGELFLKGDRLPRRKLAITGLFAGLISSLTGLGGGVFAVPVLREWMHYPIRRASFVSSGAIVISSLAALAFSLSKMPVHPLPGTAGFIVPRVAFPIGAGVVLAAPLGVKLAHKMKPQTLALLYILFVGLVLVRRGLGAF